MGEFRFAHIGVALCLGAAGITGMQLAQAAGPAGVASAFVPIAPCRLADTRPANVVGSRTTPIAAQEIVTFAVWGTNGNCTIPNTATGIATNVTSVNPTANSYLTVFPADAPQPLSSNLNWTPTSPPTPNQVTVGLSATGAIKAFNNAGSIDVIIDIVGYYVASTSGPAGPPGPQGNPGSNGTNGTNGVTPAKVIWVATAGGDFTNIDTALASITTNSSSNRYVIKVAPGIYTIANTVVLKDYVDIEGSGEDTTVITCACGTATDPATNGSSATLRAESNVNSEVRNITINNTGLGTYATAIWTGGTGSGTVHFTHVTANASGNASATSAAIYIFGSRTALEHVTANATTTANATNVGGVLVAGAGPATLHDVTATATGGSSSTYGVLVGFGSGVIVDRVTATGTAAAGAVNGINVGFSAGTVITDSTATAAATAAAATPTGLLISTVAGAANTVTRVTASATNAGSTTATIGVSSSSASTVMRDINATATGGNTATGLSISGGANEVNGGVVSASGAAGAGTPVNLGTSITNSSLVLTNLTTSAVGAAAVPATALIVNSGSPTLQNVKATSTSVTGNSRGIEVYGGGLLTGNTVSTVATTSGGAAIGLFTSSTPLNLANLSATGAPGLFSSGVATSNGVKIRDSFISSMTVSPTVNASSVYRISNSHLGAAASGITASANSCLNVIIDVTPSIAVDTTCA